MRLTQIFCVSISLFFTTALLGGEIRTLSSHYSLTNSTTIFTDDPMYFSDSKSGELFPDSLQQGFNEGAQLVSRHAFVDEFNDTSGHSIGSSIRTNDESDSIEMRWGVSMDYLCCTPAFNSIGTGILAFSWLFELSQETTVNYALLNGTGLESLSLLRLDPFSQLIDVDLATSFNVAYDEIVLTAGTYFIEAFSTLTSNADGIAPEAHLTFRDTQFAVPAPTVLVLLLIGLVGLWIARFSVRRRLRTNR